VELIGFLSARCLRLRVPTRGGVWVLRWSATTSLGRNAAFDPIFSCFLVVCPVDSIGPPRLKIVDHDAFPGTIAEKTIISLYLNSCKDRPLPASIISGFGGGLGGGRLKPLDLSRTGTVGASSVLSVREPTCAQVVLNDHILSARNPRIGSQRR